MTDLTPERLAGLREHFEMRARLSSDGHADNVLALIAALEAKTAEVEGYRQHFPCDGECSYPDGPQEECSLHGRNPRELWEVIGGLARERDEARAGMAEADQCMTQAMSRAEKAEAALERVRALHPRKEFDDSPGKFYCDACQRTAGLWPCPTVQALTKKED